MMFDDRMKPVDDIRTAPLFDMVVNLEHRLDFGAGPVGQRVYFGSAGGRIGVRPPVKNLAGISVASTSTDYQSVQKTFAPSRIQRSSCVL